MVPIPSTSAFTSAAFAFPSKVASVLVTMKASTVKVSLDTVNLFVVALFSLQLSFPTNVTVNVTSPAPTNVIFPSFAIVATLVLLEV